MCSLQQNQLLVFSWVSWEQQKVCWAVKMWPCYRSEAAWHNSSSIPLYSKLPSVLIWSSALLSSLHWILVIFLEDPIEFANWTKRQETVFSSLRDRDIDWEKKKCWDSARSGVMWYLLENWCPYYFYERVKFDLRFLYSFSWEEAIFKHGKKKNAQAGYVDSANPRRLNYILFFPHSYLIFLHCKKQETHQLCSFKIRFGSFSYAIPN